MKNVLITGASGFIGHHVVDYFIRHTDWNIVTMDCLDVSGNQMRLHEVLSEYDTITRSRVKFFYHDLKAEINNQLLAMLGDINIVLHIAASSHVDRSIDNPMEFVMNNVVGTVNILEYARKLNNLEKFVYFSTDEIFGPAPDKISFSEYDRYNSTNPYSASKASGEEFCIAFQNTYNMPIIITHTMNVFGIRQHPEKFIPKVIQRVRDGKTVPIHSDPTKTIAGSRFYINTEDVAEGLFFILNLQKYPINDPLNVAKCPKFNLVGPLEVDNLSLARMIAEVQNKPLHYEMVDFHSSRPGHDLRYGMSGELLKSLGWQPKIPLIERIDETVRWSLKHDHWLKI